MLMKKQEDLCFPTIIRIDGSNHTLEIPDLNITVNSDNCTSLLATAIETITAIVVYRVERNIPIRITHTYEDLVLATEKERGKHFIYMLKTLNS